MRKILVFLAMIVLGALCTGCGETKVDLSNYVEVSYSGLNGQATADCEMNMPDLEELLKKGKKEDEALLQMLYAIEGSISVDIDKKEDIYNGDKITATVTCDDEIAKKYDYKFVGKKKVIKVKGLSDGTVVDLFRDIKLEYDGVSPEASVTICNTSDDGFLQNVEYSTDMKENIKNGDKITVSADYNEEDAAANEYIVKENQKTYEVTGIDEYISDYGQIDDETLDKIKNQAHDLIESELADDYKYTTLMYPDDFKISLDNVKVKSIDLTGAYFFTMKEGMEKEYGDVNNSFFMVYKIKATDEDSPKGVTTFVPVYYSDFILRDTGKVDVVVTDADIPDSYANMDNLYREVVTANKGKYNFEEVKY